MSQELNRHILGRYRDGLKMVQFCQVCGKEELELYQGECKPLLSTEEKKEKFVSGLPDNKGGTS